MTSNEYIDPDANDRVDLQAHNNMERPSVSALLARVRTFPPAEEEMARAWLSHFECGHITYMEAVEKIDRIEQEGKAPAGRTVGLVELRAWAIASRNLAEREGFPGVVKQIESYITWLGELRELEPMVTRIHLVPVTNTDTDTNTK
jgi:hypothetical protein